MSDRIAVMNEGRLVRLDTPRELYENPEAHFVASFIGEATIMRLTAAGPGAARPDGGDRHVAVDHERADGTPFHLAVRPEKARLGAPAAGENAIPATVEETLYAGDVTKVILRLSTGEPAIVKLANREDDPALAPGTRTAFVWRPEDGRLLREGPNS